MFETTTLPAAAGDAREIRAVLDTMVARRASADRAEADLLALAVELVHGDLVDGSRQASAHVDGAEPAVDLDEELVAAVGAALGLTFASAFALVADAVQLFHRLPRLWSLVQQGRLQAPETSRQLP